MLKKSVLLIQIVVVVFIFTACLNTKQTGHPLEDTTKEYEGKLDTVADEETTVGRELYVVDKDGYVVPLTFDLPKTNSVAKQALQYMVTDGPIAELLPNGFRTILPAATEIISVNLAKNGKLIVDFTEQFADYHPDDELKVLQALTYTVSQFDGIESLEVWIDGKKLEEMPVSGTPIQEAYTVEKGINIAIKERPTVQAVDTVNVFYPKKQNNVTYFVPVTQYVNQQYEVDYFTEVVHLLLEDIPFGIRQLDVFNDNTKLVREPVLENNVIQLTFNKDILLQADKQVIATEVVETIVRTFTAINGIDAVEINVEEVDLLVDDKGRVFNKPVSKEELGRRNKL